MMWTIRLTIWRQGAARAIRRGARGPLTFAAALLFSGATALACSCMPPEARTMEEIRASGDIVVLGRVLSAEKTGGADINAGNRVFRVGVKEAVNLPKTREITVKSAPNGAMCGIDMAAGSLQILFLSTDGKAYWASLCGNLRRPQTETEARQWWQEFQSGGPLPPQR